MTALPRALLADRPLRHGADDLLGFERLADALAERLENAPGGVLAGARTRDPGAGLTSFLNLLQASLAARNVPVLRLGLESALRELSSCSGSALARPVLLVDDVEPSRAASLDAAGARLDVESAVPLLLDLPAWDRAAAEALARRLAEGGGDDEIAAWRELLAIARTPRHAIRLVNAALVALSLSRAPLRSALRELASACAGAGAGAPDGGLRSLMGALPQSAAPPPDDAAAESQDARDDAEARSESAAGRGDARELAALLADARSWVRHAACRALARLESAATDDAPARAIRPLLGSDDPLVRRSVAQALGRLGDAGSRSLLAELLFDRSKDARRAAAAALARLGGPPSLEPLLSALDDENAGVRMAAETALRTVLSEMEPAPGLAASSRGELASVAREALAESLRSGDELERVRAAEALGRLGDARAIDVLLEAHGGSSPRLREAAAASLVRLRWSGD
jgi:hypothetical protein